MSCLRFARVCCQLLFSRLEIDTLAVRIATMLSVQQVVRALRKLQSGSGDLVKTLRYAATPAASDPAVLLCSPSSFTSSPAVMTVLLAKQIETSSVDLASSQSTSAKSQSANNCKEEKAVAADDSRTATTPLPSSTSAPCDSAVASLSSLSNENSSELSGSARGAITQVNSSTINHSRERIQDLCWQQLHRIHTQHNHSLYAKQNHTQFAMSSFAAEPLALMQPEDATLSSGSDHTPPKDSIDQSVSQKGSTSAASGRPCFHTGVAQILQFMELIGNLKHTKRTGWVLRDVNDCESISGHMYRMSMMTFLLDGTEGLNQIRCMELALVHDLAESLVGDITPFCGVSKEDKRAMEFKAMEDICKLIEPRGKRIMLLFEEYEHGESDESKFVKDLDRLDMVMQAFEYEKRDNCLLKHQEFFDSTEGKFNHPFVKKLVDEIYEQRKTLATAKGATPPSSSNGHCAMLDQEQLQKTTSSSTS